MRAALAFLQHLTLAMVFTAMPVAALAQISLPVATPNTFGPGVRLEGLFYTAPVTVDGQTIFRIAVTTKEQPTNPIQVRAQFIESAINQVLAVRENGTTVFTAKNFRVDLHSQGSQSYLLATDGSSAPDVALLTVTSADVQYNRTTPALLGAQWRLQLQQSLSAALQKRQPAEIKRNYNLVTAVAASLILLTALLWLVIALFARRAAGLEEQAKDRQATLNKEGRDASAAAATGQAQQRRRFLALALRATGPTQRAKQFRSGAWLLAWLLALIWLASLTWSLLLFPQTAAFGFTLLEVLGRAAAIWIGAAILNKIADLLIVRLTNAYGRNQANSEERARALLRGPTISNALGGFKGFLILFVAILWTFSVVGIPVTSVVTIGGILALAISFAAQNLVRDLLNGLLVLLEDQYVVGDFVMIGDYNGIVENFTLRVVQIRDARGSLITIPHSTAMQTVNASRNWSRVDYRVAIDPAADVAEAVRALRAAMEGLAADANYRGEVVDAVETIGVELLSKNGIVLRASMRTAPLRQFELYRALNETVLREFAARSIALGVDPLPLQPVPPHGSPDPT